MPPIWTPGITSARVSASGQPVPVPSVGTAPIRVTTTRIPLMITQVVPRVEAREIGLAEPWVGFVRAGHWKIEGSHDDWAWEGLNCGEEIQYRPSWYRVATLLNLPDSLLCALCKTGFPCRFHFGREERHGFCEGTVREYATVIVGTAVVSPDEMNRIPGQVAGSLDSVPGHADERSTPHIVWLRTDGYSSTTDQYKSMLFWRRSSSDPSFSIT